MTLEAFQTELASGRYTHVIGADEVGYGSWAGPLVVVAAAVPVDWTPPKGLNDSKKVRAARREQLFDLNRDRVPYWGTAAQADEIDRDGVMRALKRCYRESLLKLRERFPESLVVLDGEVKIPEVPHLNFPKADGLVPAVMVASVFAKVIRDRFMMEVAKRIPGYGFGTNMGYGTPEHQEALLARGLTHLHRRSYCPLTKTMTMAEIHLLNEPGMVVDQD